MNLDPTLLSTILLLASSFSAAFLAALWLSLIFWTYRDIRRRSRDRLLRILAVLVVVVLFLPGILIYLILRPPMTHEDNYQQALEEEALLQSIEESLTCPGCSRRTKPDWLVCPSCRTVLMKKCTACGRLMELPWELCPYCTQPAANPPAEDLPDGFTPLRDI